MPKLSELNGWAENAPGKKDDTECYCVCGEGCGCVVNDFNAALTQVSELHEEVDVEKYARCLYEEFESLCGYMPEWDKANSGKRDFYIERAQALASTMKDWLRITKPTERSKEDERVRETRTVSVLRKFCPFRKRR